MANAPVTRGSWQLLQDRFDGGMKRDMSRDQLPRNAVWNMVDFIPDLGAPLRKRGGWSYQGNDLSTVDAAASVPKRVSWANFQSTSPQVIAWDNAGKVLDMTNNADRGDHTVPLGNPSFFRDLVVWGDGSNPAKKYDGATVASLGGSPPSTPRCSAVWKERLLLSGGSSTATVMSSIYFSAAGNAESWDTTNAVVQTNGPVSGIAAVPNAIIVFHPGSVEKFLGDTPPSSTNIGNLALQPLFDNVGLYEPTAFAVQNESVYWADENGVYKTDGTSLTDLTDKGGIRSYWQDQVAQANSVSVGVWRGYVFVSLHSSDTYVDFLVCDVEKRSWFRFGNIVAENFANRYGTTDDLYFANRETKFVGKLSTVFSPTGSVKNDAPTGDAVTPSVETAFFRKGKSRARWRRLYVLYDLRDAASDNPIIAVNYISSPELTSYSNLPGSPLLSETTAEQLSRLSMPRALRGAAFQVTQALASSDTRIYSIAAEITGSEASR